MVKLADARDSKSRGVNAPCGFDSHLRHQFLDLPARDGVSIDYAPTCVVHMEVCDDAYRAAILAERLWTRFIDASG